jgi:hypothetical protein
MSQEALDALMPTLRGLSAVREPDLPVEVSFQEAEALATLVEKPAIREALLEVGLEPDTLAGLRPAIAAARYAESAWKAVHSPRKPESQRDVEAQGRALRAKAMSACRFSLRHDRLAQGALDRIDEGEGVADLAQDLLDLAVVIERNLGGFAANRRFGAADRIPELRALSASISAGQADFRTDKAQREAVDVRNRAWTWLDHLVDEIRGAGRHAFEGTPTTRDFASEYERQQRRAQRRRKSATPEPTPA